MPAIIVPIVTTIITVGTVVYEIGKTVYNWIIKPLTKVTEIINSIRDVVRGVVNFLQDKIDYVLDVTGADVLVDLVHGIAEFGKLAEDIANGNKEALVKVLGDLYTSIAGLGGDIIHILSDTLAGVTDRIKVLQDDITYITEFKITKLTEQFARLDEEIKRMNEELIVKLRQDIEDEIAFIKSDMSERVRHLEGEIGTARFLTKDVKHFMEMFTKAMEV